MQFDLVTIATLAENEAMVGLVERKLGLKGTVRDAPEQYPGKRQMFYEVGLEEWRARAASLKSA